jgi:hypothetical protein
VDLLIQAAQTQDPTERIAFVAAFAISSYACTKHRPGRKPLCVRTLPYHLKRTLTTLLSNPMLGETFEFQDDKRKFIAEKTSHHPPIMACHAEGEGWEYWATNEAKNRLNGEYHTVKERTAAVYQDLRQVLRGSSGRVDTPEGRCRPLPMVGFASLIP